MMKRFIIMKTVNCLHLLAIFRIVFRWQTDDYLERTDGRKSKYLEQVWRTNNIFVRHFFFFYTRTYQLIHKLECCAHKTTKQAMCQKYVGRERFPHSCLTYSILNSRYKRVIIKKKRKIVVTIVLTDQNSFSRDYQKILRSPPINPS